MSMRDNFYQAFKELVGQEQPKEVPAEEEPPTTAPQMERPEPEEPSAPQAESASPEPQSASEPEPEPQQPQEAPGNTQYAPPAARGKDERTIISRNTLIEGNIRSFANLSVEGSIRGDVDTLNDVLLRGRVVGNLRCNNVEMLGSSLQGDIQSQGQVCLDGDALVLGNVAAQYAKVDGKVRGDMEISGKTEFHPNAVVLGNVRTSSIVIAEGANIQGFIDTSYLRENVDRVFPKQVVMNEEEFY